MSDKIKVYNCFNVVSSDNPNMHKEKFVKPSLVDPLESVPSLEEYVNRYLLTGSVGERFRDEEVEYIPEDEADDDFSSPVYDKDADIEDLKDYVENVSVAVRDGKKKKKEDEKVLKNKLSEETIENKEKISQPILSVEK